MSRLRRGGWHRVGTCPFKNERHCPVEVKLVRHSGNERYTVYHRAEGGVAMEHVHQGRFLKTGLPLQLKAEFRVEWMSKTPQQIVTFFQEHAVMGQGVAVCDGPAKKKSAAAAATVDQIKKYFRSWRAKVAGDAHIPAAMAGRFAGVCRAMEQFPDHTR